jgi:hypothetical protein
VLETDDINVEQRLERELKRDYHIITADKRLDQVTRDVVQHYSAAWETGKAMLVCIDKLTCVRMHGLIERYWDERIAELAAEVAQASDEQEAIYLQRQIDWMRETRAVVVGACARPKRAPGSAYAEVESASVGDRLAASVVPRIEHLCARFLLGHPWPEARSVFSTRR